MGTSTVGQKLRPVTVIIKNITFQGQAPLQPTSALIMCQKNDFLYCHNEIKQKPKSDDSRTFCCEVMGTSTGGQKLRPITVIIKNITCQGQVPLYPPCT